MSPPGKSVQSIERAFSILGAIAGQEGRAGLSGIARHTRLPKSTVSRLLATLVAIGAVARVAEDGGYEIGPTLESLTGRAGFSSHLLGTVRPYLRDLVAEIGEDAGVAVPDEGEVLYIDQVHNEHAVQVRDWTGTRHPLNAVAAGHVFLAFGEGDPLQSWPAPTTKTLTEPDDLAIRLNTARRAGYAWTWEEFSIGVNGLAAPIRNDAGKVVAAINLSGPAYRFPGAADAEVLGRRVADVADLVSSQSAIASARITNETAHPVD